ncbi:YfiR family protein [Pedobacter polaris]|nr:YfiR family protein [Pedobacter polaris]
MKNPDIEDTPNEYQLKAVFLYNFTQFVAWPNKSFKNEKDPFIIGILGENPFGSFLEETIRDESVKGHPIIVRHFDSVKDIKTCHILYINLKNQNEMEEVLIRLKNQNILTVGDASKFIQLGGIIGFVLSDNKVGFKINVDAANLTDLSISSKLLRLATVTKVKN